MLAAIRAKNPGRSIGAIGFYSVVQHAAWLGLRIFFRLRATGTQHMPGSGPVIVAVNHQSHLDAEMVGTVLPRHLNYIARASLFKNPLFGWFIRMLNSVPIKEGTSDTGAIRTAIEQLALGRAVLIFPEGTRSPDGTLQPFKRGVWLLLSRSRCPVLPVAVRGAHAAWPRGTKLPRLFGGHRLSVNIGEPIAPETLLALGPDEGLAHLRETVQRLLDEPAG
ncbi:MAG: lysophospholipid acyltransferase family protein [Phycisphaerales bacterium]